MRFNALTDAARKRAEMVHTQIAARGVRSPLVLEAMGAVPRECFVGPEFTELAYEDSPLPIDEGQTISQPYIVAVMIEALELQGGERVLEVGTGSGYAAAVLGRIAGEVFTVERHGRLVASALGALERVGCTNVHVRHGDGTRGWPEEAPFDGIVVAAGGTVAPPELIEQLAIGAHLVIPLGTGFADQKLVRITRLGKDEIRREELADVRFVPLVSE